MYILTATKKRLCFASDAYEREQRQATENTVYRFLEVLLHSPTSGEVMDVWPDFDSAISAAKNSGYGNKTVSAFWPMNYPALVGGWVELEKLGDNYVCIGDIDRDSNKK